MGNVNLSESIFQQRVTKSFRCLFFPVDDECLLGPVGEVSGPIQEFATIGMAAKTIQGYHFGVEPVLLAKYFTFGCRSTSRRPNVCGACQPTMRIVLRGSSIK